MTTFTKFVLVLLVVTNSKIALAVETKTGLPQLDLSTYPSLIFWSIISLIIGYILMAFMVTPRIKSILNLRETNIQNDLIKAKASNQEAEDVNKEISTNQIKIKSKSEALIKQAILETKDMLVNTETNISKKLNLKISNAEKKIIKSKENVMDEILSQTEDITEEVILKLTSIKTKKADIRKTIQTVSRQILMEKQ
jgi:F-type H+-transporting ATPase subunit b